MAAARNKGNTAAFLLALNLLSRTFERVHAVFPLDTAAIRHPWNLEMVREVVDELNDTVEGSIHIGAPKRSDVVLSIGGAPTLPGDREVVVRGSSWRAALNCELCSGGEGVLGHLYAACMGAAQVLLHVLDSMKAPYRPLPPFTFSLLDLLRSGEDVAMPEVINIPESHLVGVGAVGSAAIYALAHLEDLHGVLNVIDNEKVEDGNLNRYVLMRRRDINRFKVDVASAALERGEVHTAPHPDAFSRYVKTHGADVNLLLSPVDTEEGRRALAKTLPRRVINAATGGTTVTVSTHGFNDGNACLHCLYPVREKGQRREEVMAKDMGLSLELIVDLVQSNAPIDAQLVAEIERNRGVEAGRWADNIGAPIDSFYRKTVCGDAQLRVSDANVIAPLSFISASAGILLAAELVKAGHPLLSKWKLDNYFRLDTLHLPNPAFRRLLPQDRSGQCICRDRDYIDVYLNKYGDVSH